jgi:diacylglycerol kinase (ATP)
VTARDGTDGLRGLPRILRAIRIGLGALAWGFRHEEAIRWELLSWLAFLPLGLWLGESGAERALLVASTMLVLVVELLNTAIEVAVDRISLERHQLSGLAKDLGSAAVGISVIVWASTWALVLLA